MSKIYEKADDQHVRAIIVYGDTTDNYLYADAENSKYLDAAAVFDAFMKNMLFIQIDDDVYRPINFDSTTGCYDTIASSEVEGEQVISMTAWAIAVDPEA